MPGSKGRKIIAALILVVFCLAAVKATGKEERGFPLSGALRDVLSPLQVVLTAAGRGLQEVITLPAKLYHVGRRQEELEQKVKELESRLLLAEEYRLENERLKQLLAFQSNVLKPAGVEVEAAAVVARDANNFFSTMTVNKGRSNGLAPNMVVITPAGLVGRIIAVGERTAEVLLITDPRSAVGAVVQETRTPGMIEGATAGGGRVYLAHLLGGVPLEEGQVVLTSGVGSIFPRGIPIGRIVKVENTPVGLFSRAEVEPFVDFRRLEEVLIIKRWS